MEKQIFIFEDIQHNNSINTGVRAYNWSVVSYQPLEELLPLINLSNKYAYIFHDKDLCKNNHYHLLLYFTTEISFKRLKTILEPFNKSNQNTFFQPVREKLACWEYLTHKNNPDKYQYESTEICTNNASFWNYQKVEKDFTQLLDDIINGVSRREMVKRWGRDFILNYERYRSYAFYMFDEECEKK